MTTGTELHSSMDSNNLNTAQMIDNMRFKACLKMVIEMLIIFQGPMVMDLINPPIWWALAKMIWMEEIKIMPWISSEEIGITSMMQRIRTVVTR